MEVKLDFKGIIPTAKGRPRYSTRGGFARAYTPRKTRDAEEEIRKIALLRWKRPPIGEEPIHVSMTFNMPIPSSWSKKKQEAVVGKPHTSKPDRDNLEKLLSDALEGIIWEDDKVIYSVESKKLYSRTPGIELLVRWGSIEDR